MNIPGMKSSILSYVPLSAELLGPITPSVFKPGYKTPRFQTRLTPLHETITNQ